jgi:hypothetical protein
MEDFKSLALTETLELLEGENKTNPAFFVNPSGALETFFNYKGTLIDLHKYQIKLQLGKVTKQEVDKELRATITCGINRGMWVVFFVGKSCDFNFADFFKQFDFNKGDKNFFNNTKLFDKSYLKSSGILTDDLDVDMMGNKFSWKANSSAKIIYLCQTNASDIKTIKENHPGINFDFYFVE